MKTLSEFSIGDQIKVNRSIYTITKCYEYCGGDFQRFEATTPKGYKKSLTLPTRIYRDWGYESIYYPCIHSEHPDGFYQFL